uniref:RING-type domain-containing protein n=1 Tax=Arcella intermedia TaxID=1963864 RepID=A0A6B2LPP2_9EUKA
MKQTISQSIETKKREVENFKKQVLLFSTPEGINQSTFTLEETKELETKISIAMRKLTIQEAKMQLSGLESSSEALCIVCMERERKVEFAPCNHTVACTECSNFLNKCPKCREPIASKKSLV